MRRSSIFVEGGSTLFKMFLIRSLIIYPIWETSSISNMSNNCRTLGFDEYT